MSADLTHQSCVQLSLTPWTALLLLLAILWLLPILMLLLPVLLLLTIALVTMLEAALLRWAVAALLLIPLLAVLRRWGCAVSRLLRRVTAVPLLLATVALLAAILAVLLTAILALLLTVPLLLAVALVVVSVVAGHRVEDAESGCQISSCRTRRQYAQRRSHNGDAIGLPRLGLTHSGVCLGGVDRVCL